MKNQYTIPGRLPGYNELTKGHWAARQRVKQAAMDLVGWNIKAQGMWRYTGKITVEIRCFEPNRKRDDDNVTSGAAKVILDAMKNMSMIQGDGQRYVRCVKHPVEVDRERSRVEIEIREAQP